MTQTKPKARLSRDEWTEAALQAMAEQGTAGINVEELARTLGTTKGSFYHHFENRGSLLTEALARWEALITEDLQAAEMVTDPRERLVSLVLSGVQSELSGFVDLALVSSMNEPDVAASLRRANQARLKTLEAIFADLGMTPAKRRVRALQALASYLGVFQALQVTGERLGPKALRDLAVRAVESSID